MGACFVVNTFTILSFFKCCPLIFESSHSWFAGPSRAVLCCAVQDMSIDVYGRAEKKARDEAMAKAAAEADAAAKAKADQEESDLDALLAA